MRQILWMVIIAVLLMSCDAAYDDFEFEEEPFFEEDGLFDDSFEGDDLGEASFSEEEAAVTSPSSDNGFTETFADYVAQLVQEDGIAGAVVAVIVGEQVVLLEGFGFRDVAAGLPATPDTLFHIGSTNKSMTAMLVATLVDEGRLGWDTAVIDVYPDFPLDEAITFRHLLSMRSGIPDDAEDGFDIDFGTADELLIYLEEIEPFANPGEAFSYSNISSATAGYTAVFAVQGQDVDPYAGYEQLLRERVLEPMGMETAVVRVSEARQNLNYGKSYYFDGDEPVEAESEDFDGDPLAPSGTLKASAREMALYISTHLNDGVAPNGNRIVSSENMAEMYQPFLENYALGWEEKSLAGVPFLLHEGSFDNYLSIIGFSLDAEIGFVILANTADAAERLIEEAPLVLVESYFE